VAQQRPRAVNQRQKVEKLKLLQLKRLLLK
jgi:hypothetical protein